VTEIVTPVAAEIPLAAGLELNPPPESVADRFA